MQKLKTRTTTFICNLLVCVLSLASICSYFILPLWKVEASYHIQASTIEKIIEEMLAESEEEGNEMDEGDNEMNEESAEEESGALIDLSKIDIDGLVPQEGITLSFSLCLETKDVLASLGKNAPTAAQKLIDNTLSATIDQFSDLLGDISKQLTKMITNALIQTTVKDQISSVLKDEMEEIEQIMSDAGIDSSYITEKTNELVDCIFSENVTVDNISENVTDIVEEVFDKLANSGNEEFEELTLSAEDKELIYDTVSEALSFIANEDGTIDIESLIAEGLLSVLNGESFEIPDEIPEEVFDEIPDNAIEGMRVTYMETNIDNADDSKQSIIENGDNETNPEKDTQAELKALLTAKISELLPKNTAQALTNIFKVISYILLFTFFTWLYLIIKIICKLGALNNSIRMGLPLWLGWWPFLVLYAIPKSLFKSLTNPPAYLIKLLDEESKQALSEFTSSFHISFTTGAWVSFAVAIVLILFNLFFYRKLRKTLKAIAKGEVTTVEASKNANTQPASNANTQEEAATAQSETETIPAEEATTTATTTATATATAIATESKETPNANAEIATSETTQEANEEANKEANEEASSKNDDETENKAE